MNANVNVKKSGRRWRTLRRVVGWAVVVLAVGVAGGSAWSRGRAGSFGVDGHGYECWVSATSGVVQVQVITGDWQEPLNVYPDRSPARTGPWVWSTSYRRVQAEHWWWGWRWFRSVQPKGSNTFVAVPLWVIASALGACGAVLVRSARLRRAGSCARCGYDLRGLGVDAVCPECGTKKPDEPQREATAMGGGGEQL